MEQPTCSICGKNPPAENRKSCPSCLERAREYMRERAAALAARGSCISCGKEKTSDGRRYCESCRTRRRAKERERSSARRERARGRERRAQASGEDQVA